MKLQGKEIRQSAREKLRGKFTLAVGGMIFVSILFMIANDLAGQIFPVKTGFQLLIAEIASVVITTLMSIFTAGMYSMFYHISTGEGYGFSNIFSALKSNPDRVLPIGIVMAIIGEISSLPILYVDWKMSKVMMPTDMSAILSGAANQEYINLMTDYMMLQAGLMLLQLLLNFLLTLPFAMSYWILVDEPGLSGKEVVIKSIGLMKNHVWDYLKLIIGFLPAALLCCFTLGLGFFWLIPQVHMSECEFFMRIKEENNTNENITVQEI